jgi:hypothetical protein
MKSDEAVEDFKKRIEHYKATYETLSVETDEYVRTYCAFLFEHYSFTYAKPSVIQEPKFKRIKVQKKEHL